MSYALGSLSPEPPRRAFDTSSIRELEAKIKAESEKVCEETDKAVAEGRKLVANAFTRPRSGVFKSR